MILAIDFDNVIHDTKNPIAGRKMGAPMPDAQESIMDLRDAGHKVIVHTVMATNESGRQVVIDWLEFYDIDVDGVTAVKPQADYYVDDKALTHTDWQSTMLALGVDTL